MRALLMESYAMIQVFILLQPHVTAVANFVSGKFDPFRRNPPAATYGTLRFHEIPVEKHCGETYRAL